jgi:hypothetical protein
MLISEYLKLKKELKKELLREKLKKEIQQNSVFENNIFDFFDLVRSGNLGETDIYKSLKDLTDNFNIENLNHTLNDLDFYLNTNREEMISQFDHEEIMRKVNERKNKGLEIPYLKFPFSKNKTKEQREKMEKVFANINFSEKIIDIEALMFPYEFFNLYKLKNVISKKIKEETASTQKTIKGKELKWHTLIKYFVNGELSDLYKKKHTAKEIAEIIINKHNLEIKIPDIRPYLQQTFFNGKTDFDAELPKNLFTEKKLIEIYKYCKEENIKITDAEILDKISDYGIDIN